MLKIKGGPTDLVEQKSHSAEKTPTNISLLKETLYMPSNI